MSAGDRVLKDNRIRGWGAQGAVRKSGQPTCEPRLGWKDASLGAALGMVINSVCFAGVVRFTQMMCRNWLCTEPGSQ